jgi:hypothetical protein
MLDRLAIRGALCGLLSRRVPAVGRLLVGPCLGQVICEGFGGSRGKALGKDASDPRMKVLAAGLEEGAVGGVLDQGVLEAVGRVGRRAAAEDQLRSDELVECSVKIGFGEGRDCRDEFVAELTADHSGSLGHLPDRGEAVKAGHEGILEGRRDGQGRERGGEFVAVAGIGEQARLEHRLGQLLDEQRHPVGACYDLLEHLGRQSLATCDSFDHRSTLPPAEAIQGQGRDVGVACPRRGELGR